MKNRRKLLILSTSVLSATLMAALFLRGSSDVQKTVNELDSEILKLVPENAVPEATTVMQQVTAKDPANSGSTAPSIYIVTEEQRNSLKEYIQIQRKVFTADTEKEKLKELLSSPEFIESLGALLTSINPADVEFDKLQDAAIDLLLEAESLDSAVATETLISIVKDAQIENDSLSKTDRELLAHVKAEVLYLWSAKNPEMAIQLPSLLPGEISLRIWNNVLYEQKNNHIESLAEVRN